MRLLARRRILEAGAEVLRERGYGAASMEAIASRARIAVPTLYVNCCRKPQILTALMPGLKEAANLYESVR